MKMPINKEWFEKKVAAEDDSDPTIGARGYTPGLVPSAADRHYGRIIDLYQNTVEKLTAERDLLRLAVVRYGDRLRMSTVEPMALQQAIDEAFEKVDVDPAPEREPAGDSRPRSTDQFIAAIMNSMDSAADADGVHSAIVLWIHGERELAWELALSLLSDADREGGGQ